MADLVNETKLPSIPSLDGIQDANVRNILAAMKEILEVREGIRPKGDALDAGVTFRDLFNVGLTSVNVGGQVVVNQSVDNSLVNPISSGNGGTTVVNNTTVITGSTPDLTIPTAPTGLSATGTAMNVIVQWTHITDTNHSHIEVWRASSNNLGVAVKIGTSDGDIYADAIGASNATYYYWIRAVSKADITSPYNAAANAGVLATTGKIGSNDLISVDGAKIVDATIVDAKIYSLLVSKLISGRIGATESIEVGTGANKIVIDGLGNIRIGATGYAAGDGIWFGEYSGLAMLYAGNVDSFIRYNGSTIELSTTNLILDAQGNASFSGNLNAAKGTFSGDLDAVGGTFKGNLSAVGGTFTGDLSGSRGTFGGELLAGVLDLARASGVTRQYQIAGTFSTTVPTGKNRMRITICGGGGGGGGGGSDNNDTGAGGGGGGASNASVATFTVTSGQVIDLTIGAGGAFGVGGNSNGTNGLAGGNSTLSIAGTPVLTARGAGGGSGGVGKGSGGAGGSGANGGASGANGINGHNGTLFYSGGAFLGVGNTGSQTPLVYIGPTKALGGTSGVAGAKGGNGGEGAVDVNPPRNTNGWFDTNGTAGQSGSATIEFYDQNQVVLYEEYSKLRAACAKAGITYI